MISFRSVLVLVSLLVLGACDNDPAPPIEPVEPPKPRVSAPVVPVAPVPTVAPAAEPPAKQASEPAKPRPLPKPVVSTPPAQGKPEAVVAKTPVVALDLSLPEELLEPTESIETISVLPATVMPPLGDVRGSPDSPIQLHG